MVLFNLRFPQYDPKISALVFIGGRQGEEEHALTILFDQSEQKLTL